MRFYRQIIKIIIPKKWRNSSIVELEKIPVSKWAWIYCELNSWHIPEELSQIKPKDWPEEIYGEGFKENAEKAVKFLDPLMERIVSEIGAKACNRQGNIDRMTDEQHELFWNINFLTKKGWDDYIAFSASLPPLFPGLSDRNE